MRVCAPRRRGARVLPTRRRTARYRRDMAEISPRCAAEVRPRCAEILTCGTMIPSLASRCVRACASDDNAPSASGSSPRISEMIRSACREKSPRCDSAFADGVSARISAVSRPHLRRISRRVSRPYLGRISAVYLGVYLGRISRPYISAFISTHPARQLTLRADAHTHRMFAHDAR